MNDDSTFYGAIVAAMYTTRPMSMEYEPTSNTQWSLDVHTIASRIVSDPDKRQAFIIACGWSADTCYTPKTNGNRYF
jgi:hypothetical protein